MPCQPPQDEILSSWSLVGKKSPGTYILGSIIGTIVYHKMAGALAKDGLYIDELSKVRVLEPEVAHETSELKEQCRDFVESKY